MSTLLQIAETFRVAATEAMFGNKASLKNTAKFLTDDLAGELESIMRTIHLKQATTAADHIAAYYGAKHGRKPQAVDYTSHIKLADVLARFAEAYLDPEARKALISPLKPSQVISEEFATAGYTGLARAFAPVPAAT